MQKAETNLLEIAFEESGPKDGNPLLILHGWPDAPRGWQGVIDQLQTKGWRCVVPYLRGFSPTQFRFDDTPRDGSPVAFAQDAMDLAGLLGLGRFAVIGHDWGARIAYTLASLFPERIATMVTLSVGYNPGGEFKVPGFAQSRRFWYQWLMCVDKGAETIKADPAGFSRIQWDTWSPPGWFDDKEFEATAKSFTGADWLSITLNSYRSRWLPGEVSDPRYQHLKGKLGHVTKLNVPTLMLQGVSDYCDPPSESEGQEKYFTGGYERILLEGIGHFPHRESPGSVAENIDRHLKKYYL
jgi:pimeloyl-ACP methyl ester carboxylesterase